MIQMKTLHKMLKGTDYLRVAYVMLPMIAMAEEVDYRYVPRVKEEIVIDGKLEEECWKETPAYKVNYLHGKKGEANDEPLMLVKCLWDAEYLYIGYETFDSDVTAYGTGEFDGPADNRRETACIVDGKNTPGCDVVEFFISWDSTMFMWELHHNASNCFSDVWCVALPEDDPQRLSSFFQYGIYFGREDFIRDDGATRFACAASLKMRADGQLSTINNHDDADEGYSGEIRLPWRSIGTPVTYMKRQRGVPPTWDLSDAEMRLFTVLQNPTTGHRYYHDAPDFPGGWFHHGAAFWPRYRFLP